MLIGIYYLCGSSLLLFFSSSLHLFISSSLSLSRWINGIKDFLWQWVSLLWRWSLNSVTSKCRGKAASPYRENDPWRTVYLEIRQESEGKIHSLHWSAGTRPNKIHIQPGRFQYKSDRHSVSIDCCLDTQFARGKWIRWLYGSWQKRLVPVRETQVSVPHKWDQEILRKASVPTTSWL